MQIPHKIRQAGLYTWVLRLSVNRRNHGFLNPILGNTCLLANNLVSQESLTQHLSSHRNYEVEGAAIRSKGRQNRIHFMYVSAKFTFSFHFACLRR